MASTLAGIKRRLLRVRKREREKERKRERQSSVVIAIFPGTRSSCSRSRCFKFRGETFHRDFYETCFLPSLLLLPARPPANGPINSPSSRPPSGLRESITINTNRHFGCQHCVNVSSTFEKKKKKKKSRVESSSVQRAPGQRKSVSIRRWPRDEDNVPSHQ